MTARTEIFTDGSYDPLTGNGGWAAVMIRTSSEKQSRTTNYEMELRAIVEAAKLADGPCTIVSDYDSIIQLAKQRKTPEMCRGLWEKLYDTIEGKDITFSWSKRGKTFGQQLAHKLAREAAKGAVGI